MSDEPRQALCCVCGALRTCRRPRNYRRENPWLWRPVDRDWHREVGELKCYQCDRITTHAVLLNEKDRFRDHAERIHLAATGWTLGDAPNGVHERIRERYRQGRPRNPYLRHRWWVTAEDKARELGESHFAALCGELVPVPERAPEERGSATSADEFNEPGEVGDEYEDPETGLWWVAQDCVDCLKLSNVIALRRRRKALLAELAKVVDKVPTLDARTVSELLDLINAKGDD